MNKMENSLEGKRIKWIKSKGKNMKKIESGKKIKERERQKSKRGKKEGKFWKLGKANNW